MHNIVNVLNAEWFTLKWLILCYVKSTSIKKKKNTGGEAMALRRNLAYCLFLYSRELKNDSYILIVERKSKEE